MNRADMHRAHNEWSAVARLLIDKIDAAHAAAGIDSATCYSCRRPFAAGNGGDARLDDGITACWIGSDGTGPADVKVCLSCYREQVVSPFAD